MMIKLNHCVSVNGILNIHNYHLFRRAGYHVNLIPRVFIQNNSSHAVSMGFRFYPSSTWLEQFRHIVYDVLSQCRWLHFGCYIYIYIIYPCQCVYVFIELDPQTIRFPFLFLNDRTLRQSKHVMKKNYLVRWTMKTRSYKWCSHTKNHSFSWMISVKKNVDGPLSNFGSSLGLHQAPQDLGADEAASGLLETLLLTFLQILRSWMLRPLGQLDYELD